ncbi:MAG: leucyl/phenylalanyl-tRNA--protein transferase [Bacteroidales bacterium]
MTVYLLPEEPVFPPVDEAEPDGLVAIGGDLSAERLLQAYSQGIFPWFTSDEEIYWFSPEPRLIMYPDQFKISGSLKRIIRSNSFTVRFDTVFEQVIRGCAEAARPGQEGTWISEDFINAYLELHTLGFAHSIEVFHNGQLAGGLYGLSLGAAFFGESMFFRMSNASKVAYNALVGWCLKHKFRFIDCQMETSHLLGLGATPVERQFYLRLLEESLKEVTIKGPWK